ncbi:type IV pilin protein [Metabacillus sp. JX24]|uniref:type IV pilin protein n=1 Tax=Metabacillus sp. JX24 TaxID=3240759 RepID=UPI003510BD74
MFKKMLKNERGLTLIELLAVVVILGIIAAIAVPAIGNVIQNSKEDAVHSEAVSVYEAAKLHVSSNNPTDANKTYTKVASATTSDALNEYLDGEGGGAYTITISYSGGKYTYSNIQVIKDGITRTYPTVTKLRAKDANED